MKNYNDSVKINHNLNCLYISDQPCRILITGGSRSGKSNNSFTKLNKTPTTRY